MRWRRFIEHHYRQRQAYSQYRRAVVQFYSKVRCARKRAQTLQLSSKQDCFTRYAGIKTAHASNDA